MNRLTPIRIITALILTAAMALTVTGCGFSSPAAFTSFAMGSVLDVRIYASDDKAAEIYNDINNAVLKLDEQISATKENSEISHINSEGIAKVSSETMRLMTDIIKICSVCHKKIDPSIGSVSSLWGFATDSPSVPDEEELKKALDTVGLDGIITDEKNFTVSVAEGQKLDLGAFGKGAALDRALKSVGNDDHPLIVTFGGAVLIKGINSSAKNRKIGIRDPFGTVNDCFGTLVFSKDDLTEPVFISTSGAYEKSFTENGKTYHHILSPETGCPAESELASVTVVGNTGLSTDALSTFCFIRGLNEDTLQTLGIFSAEAVFIFNDRSYYITDGLKQAFSLSDRTAGEHIYEK